MERAHSYHGDERKGNVVMSNSMTPTAHKSFHPHTLSQTPNSIWAKKLATSSSHLDTCYCKCEGDTSLCCSAETSHSHSSYMIDL